MSSETIREKHREQEAEWGRQWGRANKPLSDPVLEPPIEGEKSLAKDLQALKVLKVATENSKHDCDPTSFLRSSLGESQLDESRCGRVRPKKDLDARDEQGSLFSLAVAMNRDWFSSFKLKREGGRAWEPDYLGVVEPRVVRGGYLGRTDH